MTKSPHHDESAPMSDLEQIQNERREAFRLLWGIAPPDSLKGKKGNEVEAFLSDSIRIAYEAGMEVYYRPAETISLSKYERARQEGYEAGVSEKEEYANQQRRMIYAQYQQMLLGPVCAIEDKWKKEGYRAGLERAKELVPGEASTTEENTRKAYIVQLAWNSCRNAILSALDDEIKKNDL